MIQMSVGCYNNGKIIWQGPMLDIPALPGGRCVLDPGEIFRVGRDVIITATMSEKAIQMVIINSQGEEVERLSEQGKYFEIQNFYSMVAVRVEEKYFAFATDTGKKIGEYRWIEEHDGNDKKIVAEGLDGQLQFF